MSFNLELRRGSGGVNALAAGASGAPSAEALSDLLHQIYDGHDEPQPWHGALKLVQSQLRASWVAFMLRPATSEREALIVTAGRPMSLACESPYARGNEIPPGGPFRALLPDRMVVLDEPSSERPRRQIIGADICVNEDFVARLRVCRSDGQAMFSAADLGYGQMLLPHFQRAMRNASLQLELKLEAEVTASTIDSLRLGVVTLAESGRIIRTNRTAAQFLNAGKGVRVVNDRLICDCPLEDRKLRCAIRQAVEQRMHPLTGNGVAAIATPPAGGSRYSMLVKPIASSPLAQGPRSPAVTVLMRSTERDSAVPTRLIRELFGLTRQEAAMTWVMTSGASLDQAAAALGVRRNTARTHLRSIFAKVGVRRQPALVSVILNSVAAMS